MKLAIDMAKSGNGQVVNAAIIADPSTKQVIARACDQVHSQSPLIDHTCVETCLYEQRKACTSHSIATRVESHKTSISYSASDEPSQLYTGVACLFPWHWAKQQVHTSYWHPLRHAAIVAIDDSAARDRRLFSGIGLAQMDHMQSSSVGSPAKRQRTIPEDVEHDEKQDSQINGFDSESVRPYLCTGYDIFLVWEPCTMCAMALVHQRIRRIFYALPNPNAGALGSVHRLQGEKSLNHHYAVFRVLLPAEIL
ncbi:Inactive tRNA-specific adenosine deaminase-like protein 3 [Actinidia chinensis var. chinensis]|uniref:Inactive tRNA-specific adenosine deaminase-like protein 3 n=1 Tax=Actinidia chinensis var. chinensis TaxID=1590841 RepID=A0A2R6R2C1_ACTCC|nr:Inactive tRNA-specific adenosine deaminase-like protein 3 [Actinidia chinensis var. chinensis]